MIIRNPGTDKRLLLWKGMECQPNLLLTGKKGSGKCATATELLSELCERDNPYNLPYVHLIQPTEKGIITKEQIDEIVELSEYVSLERKIFVIDDANTMLPAAQNALLKILEDKEKECLFILIAHAPLLPTIVSRCMMVPFGALSKEQAASILPELDPVVWAGADETIGGYLRLRDSENYLTKAHELREAIFHGRREDIMRSCHLVREKDPEVLTDSLTKDELIAVFCYLKKEFANSVFAEDPDRTIRLDLPFVEKVAEKLQQAIFELQCKQFHATELFELMLYISSRKDV